MGSLCSSCCGNRADDIFEGEQNDKTNLLGNPVGETSRSASQSISNNKHPPDGIGDQQAKLNRILQKTANSYIDVPALNSPVDQPTEKTKDYSSKVQATLKNKEYSEASYLLEDTPHLEKTLSEEPISEGDIKLLKDAHSSVVSALQSIEIHNSETLVIPFNGPKESQ